MRYLASIKTRAKVERLKGLLAHKCPDLSLGELFDKLCDLGLEKWDPCRSQTKTKNPDSNAAIRRFVFKRDEKCQNCGSSHAPEQDHIKPQAHGGNSTKENLRWLCRSCNQRAAIEKFGMAKMQKYLKSPQVPYTINAP